MTPVIPLTLENVADQFASLLSLMKMTLMLLMVGFGILIAYIWSETRYIRNVIAIILAANPKAAKNVAELNKKRLINVEDDSKEKETTKEDKR